MRKPSKDYILRELIDFFSDELDRDRAGTEDWIAQGDYDVGVFLQAVRDLKEKLSR